MNNKKVQDFNKKPENGTFKDRMESNEEIWSFCPVCGEKIPNIQKLKFCIRCGTNLEYLKIHRKLEPEKIINPYVQPIQYPQPYTYPKTYEPKKISDDEIIDTKNHKLWGTRASIGVPLGAFLFMNFLTAGILILFIFTTFNLELLYDLVLNPYFLIFSSFFELVFILVPVLYVSKYLQNPNLKNRLGLLGFTIRGFDKKGVIKEILIGLGFAVIGLVVVGFVSFITEIALEISFGIEIVSDPGSGTGDIESIITSADILSLILLSIVMVLVIGTSEEIVFRGFMQKGLSRSLGDKWAIILTAFIFTMIHVIGIIMIAFDTPLIILISFLLSFVPYFAISLLLGFIYYWRNENLLAVITTHGLYDALTIIIAFIFYSIF